MKETLKYLQAGAIVPVDMETTLLLVNALKAALAQPTSGDYALGYAEGFNDACKPAQPAQEPVVLAQQEFDYAYPTIEEYEELTGFKVNDTFRMGWAMARTTNDLFKQMEKNT